MDYTLVIQSDESRVVKDVSTYNGIVLAFIQAITMAMGDTQTTYQVEAYDQRSPSSCVMWTAEI